MNRTRAEALVLAALGLTGLVAQNAMQRQGGTTTTVLHGNASGASSFGSIVNADIAAGTIDLTTKVTGILPAANGGGISTCGTDLSGSKVVGTVYQNTNVYGIFVQSSLTSNAAANMTGLTDASNPPTTTVTAILANNANNAMPVNFWVAPGNFYKVAVSSGTPGVFRWFECH